MPEPQLSILRPGHRSATKEMREQNLRRRRLELEESEAEAAARLARTRANLDALDVELAELSAEPPPVPRRSETAEPPGDGSNFLSGRIVSARAAEIVRLGKVVRGELPEPPSRLAGAAAEIVRAGRMCRGEEAEPVRFPNNKAGRTADMIVRAGMKARGEVADDPARGYAAAILEAGRKARGETENKQIGGEVERNARAVLDAGRRARGELVDEAASPRGLAAKILAAGCRARGEDAA